jgi:hypothetical protein
MLRRGKEFSCGAVGGAFPFYMGEGRYCKRGIFLVMDYAKRQPVISTWITFLPAKRKAPNSSA